MVELRGVEPLSKSRPPYERLQFSPSSSDHRTRWTNICDVLPVDFHHMRPDSIRMCLAPVSCLNLRAQEQNA